MGKTVLITEKPSVAQEYKKALKVSASGKNDGYIEGYSPVLNRDMVITWCVGHLCTLSYPEVYDEAMKKWSLDTLPFLPEEYKYEVISNVKKQFGVVKKLYHMSELEAIYYAGDAGREGIYIQMLVRQMAGHKAGIEEKVIWIDSYTEREILKGIKEAKDVSCYKNKTDAAYMRGIEDYAIGINFSRALTCRYGKEFNQHIGSTDKWKTLAVGRVMTCVLGIVVEREREIRNFVETPFYKVESDCGGFTAGWKAIETSAYYGSPMLYNEFGFKERDKAEYLVGTLNKDPQLTVEEIKVSDEKKKAPLLYNLAEIQSDCTKKYKISPDETLAVIQTLYEKKLCTYPRTDARVLSSAVAAEIGINLNGLAKLGYKMDILKEIAANQWHKGILKSQYVDDSKITDHYAIIPTGYIDGIRELSELEQNIYCDIVDRFLSIFYPPAVFTKAEVTLKHSIGESFFGSEKKLKEQGYLKVIGENIAIENNSMAALKKGQEIQAVFSVKEGKTTPPKRYTSGAMVLVMESAGKMIEDEELRAQIKGSGIGTSATRAEIIKKLVKIDYISLNKKTQILTPSHIGEAVYDVVKSTMPILLKPEMTANWEKGLDGIENGTVTMDDYRSKMERYVAAEVEKIKAGAGIHYTGKAAEKKEAPQIICPKCKKGFLQEGKKSFYCSEYKNGCDFSIWKEIAGKTISATQVENLVKGGKTAVIKGFKSKSGKSFDAALELKDGKVSFVFKK